MEIRKKRCFAANGPTLELTTFEQHVCSTKMGYANAHHWEQTAAKKRNVATLNSAHQAKK